MQQLDELKEKTNEELFALYQRDQSQPVKQELTLRYVYIVRAIAVQMHNLYSGIMQMEDIINEGVIAIMKGIDRYDPEKDNKFETFISRRIRGMVIDLVRKNDWMPRDYHRQNKSIEAARLHLSETLRRQPTDEEIARHLQMDLKKCQKIQRMSGDDDERQPVQIPSRDIASQPERAFLREETLRILTEAIGCLKEKEQMVISLYYVEELNMSQIAQVMEVSEPRISQIHSGAIRKLKAYMNTHL